MNTIEYKALVLEFLTSVFLVLLVTIYSSQQSLSGYLQDVIIILVNLLLVLVPCLVIAGITIICKKNLSEMNSFWLLFHIFCIVLFIYSCIAI